MIKEEISEKVLKYVCGRNSPSEDEIKQLRTVVRRGDKRLKMKGDFVIPLRPIRNMIHQAKCPSQTCYTLQDAKQPYSLPSIVVSNFNKSGNLPISDVVIDGKTMKIMMDRPFIMAHLIKDNHLSTSPWGASSQLAGMNIDIKHVSPSLEEECLTKRRGQLICQQLMNILQFLGAQVSIQSLRPDQLSSVCEGVNNCENTNKDSTCHINKTSVNESSDKCSRGLILNCSDDDNKSGDSSIISLVTNDISKINIDNNTSNGTDTIKMDREDDLENSYPSKYKNLEIEIWDNSAYIKASSLIGGKMKMFYAPVVDINTQIKLTHLTVNGYNKMLEIELETACRHKVDYLEPHALPYDQLASACLSLHLLSVSHNNVIKIDSSPESQNSRAAAFILYNYARLCNLFNKLNALVASGIVPPLPEPELVNFSLLREEEEWELLWAYIHQWPELLQSIVNNICHSESDINLDCNHCTDASRKSDTTDYSTNIEYCESNIDASRKCKSSVITNTKLSSSIQIHKISIFIHDLSHRLSVYYSRFHILPPIVSNYKVPAHLLPTLWPRIYLLKGIQNVFDAAFSIFKLTPPTYM